MERERVLVCLLPWFQREMSLFGLCAMTMVISADAPLVVELSFQALMRALIRISGDIE